MSHNGLEDSGALGNKQTVLRLHALVMLVGLLSGCSWMKAQVAGEGFQPWSKEMGKAARSDEKAPVAHSGFFFDRKAQQIEENLGGGF